MTSHKIKTLQQLKKILEPLRKNGKGIVAISGGMDVLHPGHLYALETAGKAGDMLVVLLNSDASIKLYKGKHRPIIRETERVCMVAALECVDYVVLFDEINPKEILEIVRPRIYCVSSEWGKDCVEASVIKKHGGKIKVIKRVSHHSTTQYLRRITEASKKQSARAVFIDRDGTINDNKKGYVYTREEFSFLPNVIQALKLLSKTDYLLFIVTNQSGIGRGMYTERDVTRLHRWLKSELSKMGINIQNIYHCPHTEENACACRKPKPGLLLQAARAYDIDLSKSWMIGDSWVDTSAGREANLRTVEIRRVPRPKKQEVRAHFTVSTFSEAVKCILHEEKAHTRKHTYNG